MTWNNPKRKIAGKVVLNDGEERDVWFDGRGRLKIKRNKNTLSMHLNKISYKLIGAKIKYWRQERGMSQTDLFNACGFSGGHPKQRISQIERAYGQRDYGIRIGTLFNIAFALNIEVAELLPSVKEVLDESGVKIIKKQITVLEEPEE